MHSFALFLICKLSFYALTDRMKAIDNARCSSCMRDGKRQCGHFCNVVTDSVGREITKLKERYLPLVSSE
jgi:hypothetical protein